MPGLLERLGATRDRRRCGPSSAPSATRCRPCSTTPGTVVELVGKLLRVGGWYIGVGPRPRRGATPRGRPRRPGSGVPVGPGGGEPGKSTPHRVAGGRWRRVPCRAAGDRAVALGRGLERRTERGWEVYDAFAEGLSHDEAGRTARDHPVGGQPAPAARRARRRAPGPAAGRPLLAEVLSRERPGRKERRRLDERSGRRAGRRARRRLVPRIACPGGTPRRGWPLVSVGVSGHSACPPWSSGPSRRPAACAGGCWSRAVLRSRSSAAVRSRRPCSGWSTAAAAGRTA